MPGRPTTLATEGMVATPHYLASVAGLEVLRSGGNALDAAIAANAVLAVVYPHMCAIGGDAFILLWDPAASSLAAVNGSGRSAAAATIDALRVAGWATMPERGALTVTVPGAVDAWATALERFGTRALGDLLQPAIHYAERGFPSSPGLSLSIAANRDLLAAREATARQFLPGGRVPQPGDLLVQPELARSLRLLAADGPAALYGGALGEAVVAAVREEGGLLTLDDLRAHRSDWVQPLSTTYRDVTLVELPPNTQGVVALEMANIVEGFDLSVWGHGSAEQVHHLVESKKLAFVDRARYITDPDFAAIPLDRLTSKSYAASLRRRIDPLRAATPATPTHGNGDTVALCVVDRDGLCVSLIQSIYSSFGSGLVADDTGIVLHNRGASFSLDPDDVNRLEPRKRPMHTLIPAMLLRDGLPWVVFGTMGAHGQAQTHIQLLSALVDCGLEPQEAVEFPRWYSGAARPGDPPDGLYVEPGFGPMVVAELRRLGHDVRVTDGPASLMGHAQMIEVDRRRGILKGAADPRSDGYALGW